MIVPDDVLNEMMGLLERTKTGKESNLTCGVYIGQASPHWFFVVHQPVYKIGCTNSFTRREKVLKYADRILPKNIFTIKTKYQFCVEGLLHRIFNDSRASDYMRSEREWFYLTEDDIRWLKSIKSLNDQAFDRGFVRMMYNLQKAGYNQAKIKPWLRL